VEGLVRLTLDLLSSGHFSHAPPQSQAFDPPEALSTANLCEQKTGSATPLPECCFGQLSRRSDSAWSTSGFATSKHRPAFRRGSVGTHGQREREERNEKRERKKERERDVWVGLCLATMRLLRPVRQRAFQPCVTKPFPHLLVLSTAPHPLWTKNPGSATPLPADCCCRAK